MILYVYIFFVIPRLRFYSLKLHIYLIYNDKKREEMHNGKRKIISLRIILNRGQILFRKRLRGVKYDNFDISYILRMANQPNPRALRTRLRKKKRSA